MKKVAIVFDGDIRDRKGYVNSVLERTKRLCTNSSQYSVDVFCISSCDNWLVRKLRHTPKLKKYKNIEIENVSINLLWMPFSIIDYILSKFRMRKVVETILLNRLVRIFKEYDLISAHSMIAGALALGVHDKYNIPFVITWHGSDIHTVPFVNKSVFRMVSKLMGTAAYNIFVSRALRQTAMKINPDIESEVLYNAASDRFCRFDDDIRKDLRDKYNVANRKVVAFAGALRAIKNAEILPEIFYLVQDKCHEKIEFWIIGDGNLRNKIERKLARNTSVSCKLWGNQDVEKMPALLNCVDILVLPSQNEGLPLIVVEALQSGANVVASDVGGVKEVLGADNVVKLGDNFITEFSNKIVDLLISGKPAPIVPTHFDWDMITRCEDKIYKKILSM